MITDSKRIWMPPKDQDSGITVAYTSKESWRYNLYYYYAAILLAGNDVLPQEFGELMVLIVLVFVSTIIIGMIIGEFSSLFSALTRKERLKNEEFDILSTLMVSLQLPESLQDRVLEYYDEITEMQYVNPQVYTLMSILQSDKVKLFQLRMTIANVPFINKKNSYQIQMFTRHLEFSYYLAGDIILKQGFTNSTLFYVHKGLVEVILEHRELEHYNHKKVEVYMQNNKAVKLNSKSSKKLEHDQNQDLTPTSKVTPKASSSKVKITNLFMESLALARKKRETTEMVEKQISFENDQQEVSEDRIANQIMPTSRIDQNSIDELIDSLAPTSKNDIKADGYAAATKSVMVTNNDLKQSINRRLSKISEFDPKEEEEVTNKLMSPSIKQQRKSLKEKFHITTQLTESENRNYTSINELDVGKYFGDISILTNLPVT